jgi:hypothetical protein
MEIIIVSDSTISNVLNLSLLDRTVSGLDDKLEKIGRRL